MQLQFLTGITWCKKPALKKIIIKILGCLTAILPSSSFKLDVLGFSLVANICLGRLIFRNRILSSFTFLNFSLHICFYIYNQGLLLRLYGYPLSIKKEKIINIKRICNLTISRSYKTLNRKCKPF